MKLTPYWVEKSAKKINKQLKTLEIKVLPDRLGVAISVKQSDAYSLKDMEVDDPEGIAGVLAYALARDLEQKVKRDANTLEEYFKKMKGDKK